MQNAETVHAVSPFCILHSLGGAKGGTRTPTALGHGILSPARLPIPPLSQKVPGAPTRTRTWNQQIKSLLLYQLSYGGVGSFLTPSDTELFLSSGRGFYCGASRSYSMRSARRM